jgi:3-mercaptopyruvate sulfurtransferase SseA
MLLTAGAVLSHPGTCRRQSSCIADGKRGALTADILQNMGYQKISSLKGGLTSWLESGGIVEMGSTQTDLRPQKNISVSETDTGKSAKRQNNLALGRM